MQNKLWTNLESDLTMHSINNNDMNYPIKKVSGTLAGKWRMIINTGSWFTQVEWNEWECQK